MRYLLILFFIFTSSCGLLSESNKPVEYSSSSFGDFKISAPPNYEMLKSWAAHPGKDLDIFSDLKNQENKLPVNIFFIYPTMLSDKNDVSWNADIYNDKIRN